MFAVLLALSLVFAGCSGLGMGGNETPTETSTPAEVPTDAPTQTPVQQLAPGLTGDGVTDAFALGDAHAAILDNVSYTVYENFTIRYKNGSIFNQVTTRAQIANNNRFYIIQDGLGPNVSGSGGFSAWSDGERVLFAQTTNNNTSYIAPYGVEGEPIPPQGAIDATGIDPTNKEQIYAIFSSVETRVTDRTTRNGTTHYQIVATNVTNPDAFDRGRNPHNVSLQALIDSQGLVREYQLSYTMTLNGASAQIHRQVNYSSLGNTTIERPPWYDAAIKNVSTATSTE